MKTSELARELGELEPDLVVCLGGYLPVEIVSVLRVEGTLWQDKDNHLVNLPFVRLNTRALPASEKPVVIELECTGITDPGTRTGEPVTVMEYTHGMHEDDLNLYGNAMQFLKLEPGKKYRFTIEEVLA